MSSSISRISSTESHGSSAAATAGKLANDGGRELTAHAPRDGPEGFLSSGSSWSICGCEGLEHVPVLLKVATRLSPSLPLSLSAQLAQAPVCGGYGAVHGAFRSRTLFLVAVPAVTRGAYSNKTSATPTRRRPLAAAGKARLAADASLRRRHTTWTGGFGAAVVASRPATMHGSRASDRLWARGPRVSRRCAASATRSRPHEAQGDRT